MDDEFVQPKNFWREVLGRQEGQQEHLVENVARESEGRRLVSLMSFVVGI